MKAQAEAGQALEAMARLYGTLGLGFKGLGLPLRSLPLQSLPLLKVGFSSVDLQPRETLPSQIRFTTLQQLHRCHTAKTVNLDSMD